MSSMRSKLESILFVCSSAISVEKLSKILGIKKDEIKSLLDEVKKDWNRSDSGVVLIENDGKFQLMSHTDNADVVAEFLKDETTGELSRPSLETLSIIAYRQPITKPELEQIRGVNCSLILRNLLVRGLILEKEDSKKMIPVYSISIDFLRLLGVNSVEELPNFSQLSAHEHIEHTVNNLEK